MRAQVWPVVAGVIALTAGCSGASRDRVVPSVRGTYDKTSGKLTQIAYDRNHNGRPDTWTDMDGSRPIASRIDQDEDGTIDRWEYYDAAGALVKVGFSRKHERHTRRVGVLAAGRIAAAHRNLVDGRRVGDRSARVLRRRPNRPG